MLSCVGATLGRKFYVNIGRVLVLTIFNNSLHTWKKTQPTTITRINWFKEIIAVYIKNHTKMWDLWWTKWHWDRFFSEFFGFPLSISFHRRFPNSYHLGNAQYANVSRPPRLGTRPTPPSGKKTKTDDYDQRWRQAHSSIWRHLTSPPDSSLFTSKVCLTTCRLPSPLRCHVIIKELTRYYGVTRSQELHPVANFVISQTPLLPCLQPEGELLQYSGRILISRDTVL
jgi:hypothetical protein